jgi:hypothetical protein
MARKSIFVSDISGKEIEEGKGGKLRLTFEDARRGSVEWDVTGDESELRALLPKGRKVARRGRRPSKTS